MTTAADAPATPAGAAGAATVLECRDVWKLHQLGDEVVRALVAADLTVTQGEFCCLMGPSGSGKSTLLNIVGGLDRPTKGTVLIEGTDTSALTESQFASLRHDTVGFIFQSYNLIPFLSAVENVELPLMFEPYDRASLRRRATDLLEMVGLSHRLHHHPTKMSGGEQQRTAIARALIGNPRLVLADEPTANLDARTGATVVRMLRELCSTLGVTVVASTHDPTVAEEASRVVRMKDGRIVDDPGPAAPATPALATTAVATTAVATPALSTPVPSQPDAHAPASPTED